MNLKAAELIKMQKARKLWNQLTDTCVDENGCLDEPFLDFEIGTDREEIWHWFEDTFGISVVELNKRPVKRKKLSELKAIAVNLHKKVYKDFMGWRGLERNVKIGEIRPIQLADVKEIEALTEPWQEEIAEAFIKSWNLQIPQSEFDAALQDLVDDNIPLPSDEFYSSYYIKETGEGNYFDVTFQLAGRSGGRLILTHFEVRNAAEPTLSNGDVDENLTAIVDEFEVFENGKFRDDYHSYIAYIRGMETWLVELDKYYEYTFSKIDATEALFWELMRILSSQIQREIKRREPEIIESRMTETEKLLRAYKALKEIFKDSDMDYYPTLGTIQINGKKFNDLELSAVREIKNFRSFLVLIKETPTGNYNLALDVNLDFQDSEYITSGFVFKKFNLKGYLGVTDE